MTAMTAVKVQKSAVGLNNIYAKRNQPEHQLTAFVPNDTRDYPYNHRGKSVKLLF